MLALPQAREVAENVAAWSAAEPALAALLAAGLPVDQALARWGMSLLKGDRTPEAAAVFRSALALKPEDPVLWMNRGISLDKSNAFQEGAACFEKSLSLSPNQPTAWLLLGLTKKKQGDFAAAETAYRRTLELDPTLPIAWQCLGLLKEEQRDYPAAIAHFATCARHGGDNAPVLANIGKLCFQIGRYTEAHEAFQRAVEIDPSNSHYRQMLRKTRFLQDAIQKIPIEDAIAAYRTSFSAPEIFAESDLADLWDKSITMLGGFGHVESALRLGRNRPGSWPANPTADYILQAMAGNPGLDRSPANFIVHHFDATAETFDTHLVRDLGYDVPGKLVAAIHAVTSPGCLYDTLDAGCGTGLCGPLLRPISRTLAGVDLSSKMLEQVAKRGIYDQIICEELTAFLDRSEGRFDLMVAADVVIYFGDLLPLFSSAGGAVRPGGLLALSTQSGPETAYRLLPSGHFAHAPEYVRAAGKEHFTQELCAETTIRLEAAERVPGHLFLFRRRD